MGRGHTLRARIDLQNAQAVRNAQALNQQLQGVGDATDDATRRGTRGMQQFAGATGNAVQGLVAMGGAYLGWSGLQMAISTILQQMREAIKLRDELATGRVEMMGQMAAAAAQLGLTEAQAVELAGRIAPMAGAGPEAFPQIGGLLQMMASSGMIQAGAISGGYGPGGVVRPLQVAPGVAPRAALMYGFLERVGARGQGAGIGRMVNLLLAGQPATRMGIGRGLGQIEAGFYGAEAADWGAFISGALKGMPGMVSAGISPQESLAQYSALIRAGATEAQAGEVARMVAEQVFGADRPEIAAAFPGYWKRRKADPTGLFQDVIARLVGATGPEGARLMEQMGIQPELRGRLAKMRYVRGGYEAITTGLAGVNPEEVIARQQRWVDDSSRAQRQATESRIALGEFRLGERQMTAERFRRVAEFEQKQATDENRVKAWFVGFKWGGAEEAYYFMQALRRYYGARGWAEDAPELEWGADITGPDVQFVEPREFGERLGLPEYLQRFPRMREATRYAPGVRPTTTINTVNNYSTDQTPRTMATTAPARGGP